MASIFCPDCGAKNNFTLKKPNFCQSCGETFSAFGMVKDSKLKSKSSANLQNEDSVPNISKLEYEIDLPKNNITILPNHNLTKSYEIFHNFISTFLPNFEIFRHNGTILFFLERGWMCTRLRIIPTLVLLPLLLLASSSSRKGSHQEACAKTDMPIATNH